MKSLLLSIVAVWFFISGYSSSNRLILIVEKEQDLVKMMWNFNTLPDNVSGFHLQKRSSSNSSWQDVAKNNIRFGMTKKNIKNVDVNDKRKEELIRKYARLISKDDRLTSKNINDYMQKHPDEKRFMLWALCMDYEASIISGLGFIDAFDNTDNTWEYRVVPIIGKKMKPEWASKPVAIHHHDNFSKDIQLQTAFVKYDDKINIHLNASKETFEQKHLKGFVTYQLKEDGSKIPVNRYMSIPKRNKRGYAAVTSAKDVNPNETHTFIVQPITIFDTPCAPILVNYRPN